MWSDCWRWCSSGLAWREHEPILTDAGLLLRLRSAITQDINTVCWGQAREPRASGNGKHCAARCRPQKLWQAATAIAWLWEGDDWIWSMRNILRKTETHAWMRCADMIGICKWTKSAMSHQKLSQFNCTCVTFPTYTLVNTQLSLFISNSTIPSLCLPPPQGGVTRLQSCSRIRFQPLTWGGSSAGPKTITPLSVLNQLALGKQCSVCHCY